jgi:hypothetical protein
LPKLENDIEALVEAIEQADDPTDAFRQLKEALHEYKARSRDIREDWYRQRNTISRQAATIAESEIDLLAGHRAPTPGEGQPPQLHTAAPDVIAIEKAPECLFVKTSYGFTNLLHVVGLDVKARTLFTTSGTRSLTDEDTRTFIYHLKNHCAR